MGNCKISTNPSCGMHTTQHSIASYRDFSTATLHITTSSNWVLLSSKLNCKSPINCSFSSNTARWNTINIQYKYGTQLVHRWYTPKSSASDWHFRLDWKMNWFLYATVWGATTKNFHYFNTVTCTNLNSYTLQYEKNLFDCQYCMSHTVEIALNFLESHLMYSEMMKFSSETLMCNAPTYFGIFWVTSLHTKTHIHTHTYQE